MFLHYVVFVAICVAAFYTKPDNSSFRLFLESVEKSPPPRSDGGFLSTFTSLFASSSNNLPEFKTTDCLIFTLHELEDGRVYCGVFGLFFLVRSRGGSRSETDAEGGRNTVDGAVEAIEGRAAKAKAASDYASAGSLHLEAAGLLKSSENLHGAAEHFENAYKAFNHIKDMGRAGNALFEAANCFRVDQRTMSRAARAFENLSQLERKRGENARALQHMNEALSCFEQAGDARSFAVAVAAADLTAECGDYALARTRLEDCAAKVADDPILAHKLPNILLDACLCALAIDPAAISRTYLGYVDRFPAKFEASTAGKAVRDLSTAVDRNDVDAFDRCTSISSALLMVGWRRHVIEKQRTLLETESIT